MDQGLVIRLRKEKCMSAQTMWGTSVGKSPSPLLASRWYAGHLLSCKPTFDPWPAPCLTGQLLACPAPRFGRAGNLDPEPAVGGAESMAGASGTLAHYELKVMNPISSLALKAEKQEAEGGDRK